MTPTERLRRLAREITITADFIQAPPTESVLRKLSEAALELASQAFRENRELARQLEGRAIQL